jgi:5-methylcytosine-specific restriction endonuclease McrA
MLLMTCEWCNASFELLPSRVFVSRYRFCSKGCWRAACRAGKAPRETERGTRAYRRFRDSHLAKADKCVECGATEDLLLHHLIRTRVRPDLLFAEQNLRILCRACHTHHHASLLHMQPPEVAR